jgi:hypothetical protein
MMAVARRRLCCVVLFAVFSGVASGEPAAGPPRVTEGFANRQLGKIDAQVEKIRAHSAPGAQMYFLGVAGFANERVFAEEIAFASRRMAERFGSAERSVWLVSDRRDIDTYPLATGPALRHALQSLGRVMDQDDVLFVALSSHGMRGAGLILSNSGLPDDWLNGADLAAMLKESGIRWKIIVVSACYSGSFIETLADNHTIVITASSKRRTSFGCSDDRDLTYFGEAFYRDALASTASLRAAFAMAGTAIRRREREERFRPSQPQAYFGPLIEGKLQEMRP